MTEEEKSSVLGHKPFTFKQMKEIEALYLQHDWEALRNQAAIAAMQGLLSNPSTFKQLSDDEEYRKLGDVTHIIAVSSVMYADKLLEKLRKEK